MFKDLEWMDNICIRTAYELDKIELDPEYSKSAVLDGNSLRIVNSEIWTRTDYEIEQNLNESRCDRPFEDYPGAPYGMLTLPPFLHPHDAIITPLKFMGWNQMPSAITRQLYPKTWKSIPALGNLKDCGDFITRN